MATQSSAKKEKKENKPPGWVHFVAGGTGGTVAMIITCPLEVIKTRLQGTKHQEVSKNYRFGEVTLRIAREILEKEGVRGLWKGVGPNLVGVAPSRAIHFATYQSTKRFLTEQCSFSESDIVNLSSAVFAGISVATVTAPIWLVKTRMQLQRDERGKGTSNNYKNSFDCVRRVYKEEGIRAFYKGLVASYIGVSESALQFVLYERFKAIVQKSKYMKNNSLEYNPNGYKSIELNPFEYLGVASVAKLIAAVVTYPHEVVRTRVREQRGVVSEKSKYTGFVQTLRVIAAEEGVKGLYGGMGAHLLRVVPNAAIMFFTYETVVKFLS